MSTNSVEYAVDDRHALYVGWVTGLLSRLGVPVAFVDDEQGNHLAAVAVLPPPPDWSVSDDPFPYLVEPSGVVSVEIDEDGNVTSAGIDVKLPEWAQDDDGCPND
jgi:hypothetical protein